MAQKMSERQVLKKLGIEDFRHVTKDKVIALASMYDRLDPEVAIKAIEQFPEFSKLMSESIGELRQTVEKGLESGAQGTAECMSACNKVLDSLDEALKDENLTTEDKQDIFDRMQQVLNLMRELDSDNKHFISDNINKVVAAVVGVAAMALVALGGQALLQQPTDIDV